MSLFQYRAMQADGSLVEGSLETGGRHEAYRLIEARGLTPVAVEERTGKEIKKQRASEGSGHRRVSFRALENFTRQLSGLLAAGVPLSRSLQILCRETSSPAARAEWKAVYDLVIDGTPLADAMERSPKTFPRVYTAMVRAGETGGFLDVVLGQIADFQLREKELRSKVVTAMIYPAVLMSLAAAVLVFLLTFFIPRFQTIFEGFGGDLPVLTQIVVAASDAILHYGIWIGAAAAGAVYIFVQWLKSERGRRAWQRVMLRIPIVGPLNARFAMTRFCRMLGTLVASGVPLMNGLRVARESIGNQTLVDAVTSSIERVKQGDGLAASLADCPALFPASVLEMISVAEETGRLDTELVRLAAATDSELDRQLRTAVSLAEPFLLMIMAALIGTIFVSMVLPIFTIQDYIN